MNSRDAYKRILAAQKLLSGSTTTTEKLASVRRLIQGIRPELDEALAACERELATVSKILEGDVVTLAVENLPEGTEEEKKCKKALMFFIDNWNKLKGEIARVQSELAASQGSDDKNQNQSPWGNIVKHAVGPLGLVTVIAVGAVLLQTTAVEVVIQNDGCGTFAASKSMPIPIPGFSLPSGEIPSGSSAIATLPPFTISVDGTQSGMLAMKALTFTMSFGLPDDITAVTIDGTSLLNKKTEVHLSDSKTHTLVLQCG